MALFTRSLCVCAALLLAVPSITTEHSSSENEEATVEVEEEDQYRSPQVSPDSVYLAEHFDDEAAFNKKWVKSEAKKQGVDENIAKYDGKWEIQSPVRRILKNDLGLVLTSEAKHAAISALLDKPFYFKNKPLVVQYEVTMQEGQNCGGAYLKLLSKGTNTRADLRQFHDQTPYTIMFGPDKCGNDNKLHFIFRHQNPKNGSFEEKHSKKPTKRLEDIYKDKAPHLYTLIVRPDNTWAVLVDGAEANAGSLLEDFTPPVNPPDQVDDPNDTKPADWDDREKIVDPTASKPADWDEAAPAQIVDPNAVKPDGWLDDEPEMVPDPAAEKPADWDDDMDGSWEAPLVDNPACAAAPGCGRWQPPLIPNPNYKGVWRAPLVPNPNYRGKWAPRRIPNPHYFRDDNPFRMTPITAVGFELWSMSPLLLFDNLIVTDDEAAADQWARQTYYLKRAKISSDEESAVERALRLAGEHPVVFVLVIIVAFLVVGGAAYLCCGPRAVSEEVDAKKTDAVSADDVPRAGKASLEREPEPEPEQEPERDSEREPDSDVELLADTEPEADADAADTTPLVDPEGAGDGQRRRKPRKE